MQSSKNLKNNLGATEKIRELKTELSEYKRALRLSGRVNLALVGVLLKISKEIRTNKGRGAE